MEIYNQLQQISPKAFRTFDELYDRIAEHFQEELRMTHIDPFEFLGVLIGQRWVKMDEEGEFYIAESSPRPL